MTLRLQLARIYSSHPVVDENPLLYVSLHSTEVFNWCCGCCVNDADEFLLVEHVFHPRLPWGLPGGWIGFNEDPVKTVQREIQEELGLDVSVDEAARIRKNTVQSLRFCLSL